jgi:FAD/FMN-containing dehydrogenase
MNILLDELTKKTRQDVVLSGDAVSERYTADWSRENPCRPDVVLRPRTTEEVSIILNLCNDAGQPIVTQGGMTGLAGGATPLPGEWGLSLELLNVVVELDSESMTMTARAGTPLETLQNYAHDAGFMLPLDLGARGSCTIGGNVATNAGGNQVIQYGMTRSLVLGLEAVLADGTVISSKNKLLKNNTGFDLKHLFIGSEGTLGVITEVVLRLYPEQTGRHSALCGLSEFKHVTSLLKSMRKQLPVLSSFEVMWKNYFRGAIEIVEHIKDPFINQHEFYVLIESEGNHPVEDKNRFQAALFQQLEKGLINDAILAQSMKDREDFWKIRDAAGEIIHAITEEANFDIGIPVNQTESCIGEIETELRRRFGDLVFMVFGHLGDGNLHIIASTGNREDKREIYDIVYRITGAHNGGIAAEHGIGVIKKPWLSLSRSKEEIALMKTLKTALDPKNILNRGRVI